MNRIVIDTETTNSLEEPLAYDIGWAIIDEKGTILKTESFAVAEIFLDKELMSYAFFVEKIPTYWEEIKTNKRKLAKLSTIYFTLKADCKKYHISEIYAHNMRFDDMALKFTQRFVTKSKYRYFLPWGVIPCDTLKMSRIAFNKDKNYINFCEENNYKTAKGQKKMTAEVLYRFLSGKNNFEEVHQGLDDVLIEKEILLECLKRGINNGALYE